MSYDPDAQTVAPEEVVARFALEKSYFRPSEMAVKPKAFLPDMNGEVSVFRIDGLDWGAIWALGDAEVGAKRTPPKDPIASCTLVSAVVAENGLSLDKAEPPQRHAVIVGWPPEDERRLAIQLELAGSAVLRMRDSP